MDCKRSEHDYTVQTSLWELPIRLANLSKILPLYMSVIRRILLSMSSIQKGI